MKGGGMKVLWRRIVTTCPEAGGEFTVPKGNLLGTFTVRLPDALTPTVQSSIIELRVSLSIDGVPIPLKVESEQYYATVEAE